MVSSKGFPFLIGFNKRYGVTIPEMTGREIAGHPDIISNDNAVTVVATVIQEFHPNRRQAMDQRRDSLHNNSSAMICNSFIN